MIRFYYIILASIFLIFYFVPLMNHYIKHPEKYDEYKCYRLAQKIVNIVKRKGRIHTHVTGKENLPKEGGYIMYANHQGKYDALGIISAHDKPCSVVIDSVTASKPIAKQIIDLVRGARFVKNDLRQQGTEIIRIIKEVKAGRKYLIFPEAGYVDNRNELIEFHAGSFKMALKAGCPIIPVALVDSFKPFGINSLKKVKTQLHFLEPIPYEEYKDMNTQQISTLVKERIRTKIQECLDMRTEEEKATDAKIIARAEAKVAKVNAREAKKTDSKEVEGVLSAAEAPLTKHSFLGVYSWTVLLSYLALVFGVFGSFMALKLQVISAMMCLILAFFVELLDRKVNSSKNWSSDEKRYGTHVDSLSDLVGFGILPCLIGWAMGLDSVVHILFYVFYIGSVVVRLAYLAASSKTDIAEGDKYCQGLPIKTIVFLLFVLFILKDILGEAYELIMTCVYPLVGIFYITNIRIRKPKVLTGNENVAKSGEIAAEAEEK